MEDMYLEGGGKQNGVWKAGYPIQTLFSLDFIKPLLVLLLATLLAVASKPRANDLASLSRGIIKCTLFWLCSFFILLSGEGQPGRTLHSFPWWFQVKIQQEADWCLEEQG